MIKLGFRIWLLICASLVLQNCHSSSSGGSDSITPSSFQYTASGTADLKRAALIDIDLKVAFELSWSEENGVITGSYKDDKFLGGASVQVTGTVVNGVRTFTIALSNAVDGVTSLVIQTAAVSGSIGDSLVFDSFAAQNQQSQSVYSGSNITVTVKKADAASDVGKFFTDVAKTYSFYATKVSGTDQFWTTGKQYDLTVAGDKTLKIKKDDGSSLELRFGDNPDDKFADEGHEINVQMVRDQVKVLMQQDKSENKFFVTVSLLSGGAETAFYKFSAEKEAEEPKKAIEDWMTKSHTCVVTVGGNGHSQGSNLTFVLDESGDVEAGDLSNYKFKEGESWLGDSTVGGMTTRQLNYSNPNPITYPGRRATLTFDIDNKKLKNALFTLYVSASAVEWSVTCSGS